jgi:hypothetical protein
MKKPGLLTALACMTVSGVDTSHDAPIEFLSNSVHVFFRTDTLLDPLVARSRGLASASQILQHTHSMPHKLRIFTGGRPASDLTISPNDELHFRLAGKRRFLGLFPGPFRGYMTVKPLTIKYAGQLVGAHGAKANETRNHCAEYKGERLEKCLVDALSPEDKNSLDFVWVVEAPSGFSWKPIGTDETAIGNLIRDAGHKASHKEARDQATRIEFDLAGNPDVFIDRFFVVEPNKRPKGHGIEFHRGTRMVVCENRTEKVGATGPNILSQVCPDR